MMQWVGFQTLTSVRISKIRSLHSQKELQVLSYQRENQSLLC